MKRLDFDLRNTHSPSRVFAHFLSFLPSKEQSDMLGVVLRIGIAAEFEGIDEAIKQYHYCFVNPLPNFDWSKNASEYPTLKTRGVRKKLFLVPNAQLDSHIIKYLDCYGDSEYQSVLRRCLGSAVSILISQPTKPTAEGAFRQSIYAEPIAQNTSIEKQETEETVAHDETEDLESEDLSIEISLSELDPANYT